MHLARTFVLVSSSSSSFTQLVKPCLRSPCEPTVRQPPHSRVLIRLACLPRRRLVGISLPKVRAGQCTRRGTVIDWILLIPHYVSSFVCPVMYPGEPLSVTSTTMRHRSDTEALRRRALGGAGQGAAEVGLVEEGQ